MRKLRTMDILKLAGCIALCLVAGFIGSTFTVTDPDSWYADLNKPSFNPPSWLFAPVWTTLYILMGIAFYLILKERNSRIAITLFLSQLILNTLWTIIFFWMQNPLLAFIEIIILWLMMVFTIREFYVKSRTAAYLMLPYLLWVTFASVLTLSIHLLNLAA